jgi:hypothetical protein
VFFLHIFIIFIITTFFTSIISVKRREKVFLSYERCWVLVALFEREKRKNQKEPKEFVGKWFST